jgi:hypothetical protein
VTVTNDSRSPTLYSEAPRKMLPVIVLPHAVKLDAAGVLISIALTLQACSAEKKEEQID